MTKPIWDSSIPKILRRRTLQPEDEARGDGSRHEASHGDPDGNLVPSLLDEPQQEETKRPFRNRHAEDRKCLANGLEEDRMDLVVGALNVLHVLPEAKVCRDGGEDGVEDEKDLKGLG